MKKARLWGGGLTKVGTAVMAISCIRRKINNDIKNVARMAPFPRVMMEKKQERQ